MLSTDVTTWLNISIFNLFKRICAVLVTCPTSALISCFFLRLQLDANSSSFLFYYFPSFFSLPFSLTLLLNCESLTLPARFLSQQHLQFASHIALFCGNAPWELSGRTLNKSNLDGGFFKEKTAVLSAPIDLFFSISYAERRC